MRKLFKFGLASLALSLCVGSGVFLLKGQKAPTKVEAAAETVTMHFPGQSVSTNPKVKYRSVGTSISSNVSVGQYTVGTDYLQDGTITGNATTSWTITTTSTKNALELLVPVRLAINVPAKSHVYLNSFSYRMSVSSGSSSKIELIKDSNLTASSTLEYSINTKSSLAENYVSSSSTFSYSEPIRFYNQTSSAATKTLDYFWLHITMPSYSSSPRQASFTFSLSNQNVSDADEVVVQIETNTYSASEFCLIASSLDNKIAKVLYDFTLPNTLTIAHTVTFNLNGCTVTASQSPAIEISSTGRLTVTSSPAGGILTTSQSQLININGGSLIVNGSGQTLRNTSTADNTYVIYTAMNNCSITLEGTTTISGGKHGIGLPTETNIFVGGTTTFVGQNSGYGIYSNSGSAIYLYENANVGKIYMPRSGGSVLYLSNAANTLSYINTTNDLYITYDGLLSDEKNGIALNVYNQSVANHVIFNSIGIGYMAAYYDSTHRINCVYFSTTPTFVLSHCSVDNPNITLNYNEATDITFTVDRGYVFPNTIDIPLGSASYSWSTSGSLGQLQIKRKAVYQDITISITAVINTEGKALEFINSYMHMDDYNDDLGWCKDSTHHYYVTAKDAFNSLEQVTRIYLMTNTQDDIVAAKERFIAWATANGEKIVYESSDYIIKQSARYISLLDETIDNSTSAILIIVAIASLLIVTGLIIFKKRKHN